MQIRSKILRIPVGCMLSVVKKNLDHLFESEAVNEVRVPENGGKICQLPIVFFCVCARVLSLGSTWRHFKQRVSHNKRRSHIIFAITFARGLICTVDNESIHTTRWCWVFYCFQSNSGENSSHEKCALLQRRRFRTCHSGDRAGKALGSFHPRVSFTSPWPHLC